MALAYFKFREKHRSAVTIQRVTRGNLQRAKNSSAKPPNEQKAHKDEKAAMTIQRVARGKMQRSKTRRNEGRLGMHVLACERKVEFAQSYQHPHDDAAAVEQQQRREAAMANQIMSLQQQLDEQTRARDEREVELEDRVVQMKLKLDQAEKERVQHDALKKQIIELENKLKETEAKKNRKVGLEVRVIELENRLRESHDQKLRDQSTFNKQQSEMEKRLRKAQAQVVKAEKDGKERARQAVEAYRESEVARSLRSVDEETTTMNHSAQLSQQQQSLMSESGKMLEYLRKEVLKLRGRNKQLRTDFDTLKQTNQRLVDANAEAGASFSALNEHAQELSRRNDELSSELKKSNKQNQKLQVTEVELREELKMKQATYSAEVRSRLQYQKALASAVDLTQAKSRDSRLIEQILKLADDCETQSGDYDC